MGLLMASKPLTRLLPSEPQGKNFKASQAFLEQLGRQQGWRRGAGPLTEIGTFQEPGIHAIRGHPSGCFGSLCLAASASSWILGKDVWPRVASSRFDATPSDGNCVE